jgi:hypothetical protein
MSKKSKALQKQKNLIEKRKRKASNRARYDALREAGQNSKSVRSRRNSKTSKKKIAFPHAMDDCGNYGCKKCYPRNEVVKKAA